MFAVDGSHWKPVFIHTVAAPGELFIFAFTMMSSGTRNDANALPMANTKAPDARTKFLVFIKLLFLVLITPTLDYSGVRLNS